MKFKPTPLKGAYLIDLKKIEDERGFFGRVFSSSEFEEQALEPAIVQINNSFSAEKGTLRGLHYQLPPREETKLIRCIKGSLYDLILDIRKDSPTFGQSFGATLTAENRTMMYVPKGFAHGFITLEPNTEMLYFVSETYSPEYERGIRWNDPKFSVSWPIEPTVLSERDCQHPDFDPSYHFGDL